MTTKHLDYADRIGLDAFETFVMRGNDLTPESVAAIVRRYTEAEIERQFQELCHDASPDDRKRFLDGCHEYQRKLFGSSERDDLQSRIAELEAESDRLRVAAVCAMQKCERFWNETTNTAEWHAVLASIHSMLREALRPTERM